MDFDEVFLSRLRQRDPDACTFLVSSLTPVLEARLNYTLRDFAAVEDARNETLYRVFRMVDEGRVRKPEKLGSFARGVCDRVVQETRYKDRRTEPWPDAGMEPTDPQPDPIKLLVEKERRARVWHELKKLPEADRRLILETHCEERDRCAMARDRGISTTGLNVRLCRALQRLRALVSAPGPAALKAGRKCRPRAARPAGDGAAPLNLLMPQRVDRIDARGPAAGNQPR